MAELWKKHVLYAQDLKENLLKDDVKELKVYDKNGGYVKYVRLPSEALRENIHGKWLPLPPRNYVQEECGFFQCSNCGARIINKWNFCPNCGADMRGNND